MRRRSFPGTVRGLGASAAVLVLLAAGCGSAPAQHWRLAWRSETVFGGTIDTPMTCRMAARLAGNGDRIRVELTSPVGHLGYQVLAAGLGRATGPGSLNEVAASQHPVRFDGNAGVRVPPGGRVLSDPTTLPVLSGDIVTVTLTVGAGDAARKGARTEPVACAPGVVPVTAAGTAFTMAVDQGWVRALLVDGAPRRSIVAVGDSLTENSIFAPPSSYERWTDVLLARGVSVVNAGVSGGRLIGVGMWGSQDGLSRISAVLAEPGVTDLVLALGTNDLGAGESPTTVLAGVRTTVAEAVQRGVRPWVVTVPPRFDPYWNAPLERSRIAYNTALRAAYPQPGGAGLIDLDAALRDPVNVTRLLPIYDAGDGLHLSPVGEHAFAQAVAAALKLPMS